MTKKKLTDFTEEDFKALPIEYVEGGSADFVVFIQSFKDKAQVCSINGHFRWVCEREDGTRFIARPITTKGHE